MDRVRLHLSRVYSINQETNDAVPGGQPFRSGPESRRTVSAGALALLQGVAGTFDGAGAHAAGAEAGCAAAAAAQPGIEQVADRPPAGRR